MLILKLDFNAPPLPPYRERENRSRDYFRPESIVHRQCEWIIRFFEFSEFCYLSVIKMVDGRTFFRDFHHEFKTLKDQRSNL